MSWKRERERQLSQKRERGAYASCAHNYAIIRGALLVINRSAKRDPLLSTLLLLLRHFPFDLAMPLTNRKSTDFYIILSFFIYFFLLPFDAARTRN